MPHKPGRGGFEGDARRRIDLRAADDVAIGRAAGEPIDRVDRQQEALQVDVAEDPRVFLELAVIGAKPHSSSRR